MVEAGRQIKDDAAETGPSVDRLRGIVEQCAPVILQMDMGGLIEFAGGFHLGDLGVSPESLLGSTFTTFINGDPATERRFKSALSGEFCTSDLTLGGCDFEVRLTPMVNETGRVTGVTAVFADITKRAKAAAELLQSEMSFRVLIESSPDAIFVHRFGRITYANEATRVLLRHACIDDLLGRPVLELFSTEDRELVAEGIRNSANASDALNQRHMMLRNDGSQGCFDVTTMPIQHSGEPAVVHVARDVTQSLRMQQKLAQTERLAALGTLAGGVGHEINNPLAYMTANLTFIAEELTDLLPPNASDVNEDLHSALQDVRDGTDRVRDIVRQLSEFTRVDESTETLFDPRAAIDAALRMSWNHIRRQATVETNLCPTGKVLGNQARLGQVILALMLNATEAFKGSGPKTNEVRVSCSQLVDEVLIKVQDNGAGIPADAIPNLFDPFFSVSSNNQSTGLGLSVAHSIVTSMNGRIELESVLGKGTTFSIYIPTSHESDNEVAAPQRTVLVVTDEVRLLEAAQVALKGQRVCYVGRMSLAEPELANESLDAILCDLSSADVDIGAFATRAMQICSPVFLIAQAGTAITKEETEKATLLLRKPVGADTIAMNLAKFWE